MIPPAIPPTIGPHLDAGVFSSDGEEEPGEVEVNEEGGDVEETLGRVSVEGGDAEVDTAGRERERVIDPVGVDETNRDADADASAIRQINPPFGKGS